MAILSMLTKRIMDEISYEFCEGNDLSIAQPLCDLGFPRLGDVPAWYADQLFASSGHSTLLETVRKTAGDLPFIDSIIFSSLIVSKIGHLFTTYDD